MPVDSVDAVQNPSFSPFSFSPVERKEEEITVSIPKPVLQPPLPSPQRRMIDLSDLVFDLSSKLQKSKEKTIQEIAEEIKAKNAEKYEKLREVAENTRSEDTWTLLSNMASCAASGVSLAVGAALIASGVGIALGSVMVAAGALGIINVVLSETGAYKALSEKLFPDDREKQELFQWFLPGSIALVETALSLIGFGLSFFAFAGQLAQIATNIGNAIVQVATGVASAGKGITKAKGHYLDAEKTRIEGDLFMMRQKVQETTKEMKDVNQKLDVHKKLAQGMNEHHQSALKILSLKV